MDEEGDWRARYDEFAAEMKRMCVTFYEIYGRTQPSDMAQSLAMLVQDMEVSFANLTDTNKRGLVDDPRGMMALRSYATQLVTHIDVVSRLPPFVPLSTNGDSDGPVGD